MQNHEKIKKITNKIHPNIILLGLVSFIQDVSSEIIFPILPLFLASLGATGVIIGLVGGLSESIASIFKVISGYMSDKKGKCLPFVFWGYSISAFSKTLLSFSDIWQHAVLFVSLDRVGKGLRTAPRDVIIAESSGDKKGKAFGIHRAMDTMGAVVGSIMAFILIYFFGLNFQTMILAAGIIGLFSLIPLLFVREEKKSPVETTFKINLKLLPGDFRKFLMIACIFALGNFTYMFFILKTQFLFSGEMAIIIPILLYAWFNVVYAALSFPAGMLADKIGKKKVLIAGYLFFALTCLGFIMSDSFSLFVLFFALYGLTYAFIDATQRAYISEIIPENLRGTGLGTFHTVIGLAALPGGIIAGLLWEFVSPDVTFIFGGIVGVISAILLLKMIK